MTLEEFVSHFEGVRRSGKGYSCKCPSHDDKRNSLSADEVDEKFLIKCHAGCETESVLAAVGLTMSDLFIENGKRNGHDPVIERYIYTDECDKPLFRVCRTASKNFFQERFDSGVFIPGLNGVRRVLYNLPAVIKTKSVLIVEGEKDVETLRAQGLVATTNAGGANAWRDDYAASFEGKRVVILPDNDNPGRAHAWRIAKSIISVAESVRLIELPELPDKGDVSDFLKNRTKEELLKIVKETNLLTVDEVNSHAEEKQDDPEPQSDHSEDGIEIVNYSKVTPKKLAWLWHSRIPLGKVTVLDGDPGLGKSLMSIDIAAAVSTGKPMPNAAVADLSEPAGVVFLSAEDDPEDTIQPRLALAGADLKLIRQLKGVKRDGILSMPTIADLMAIKIAVNTVNAKLVVIDPLMAFLPGETNSYRDQDVRRSLAPLAALAAELNVAILVIRHLNKAANVNPLYRGGGSIGIIGAARSGLLVVKDPDDESRVILSVAKSNLAKLPASLAYEIRGNPDDVPWINWLGPTNHTAASLLHDQADTTEDRSAGKDAEDFLSTYLKDMPRKANDILKASKAALIAEKTLRRAKAELKVWSRQKDFNSEWYWGLPRQSFG